MSNENKEHLGASEDGPGSPLYSSPEAGLRGAAAIPRAGAHPESYCHKCGGPNSPWSVQSPLWNTVMRQGPDDWKWNEIICTVCFMKMAEGVGLVEGWKLVPAAILKDLPNVSPDGRIWNPIAGENGLWEEPRYERSACDRDAQGAEGGPQDGSEANPVAARAEGIAQNQP